MRIMRLFGTIFFKVRTKPIFHQNIMEKFYQKHYVRQWATQLLSDLKLNKLSFYCFIMHLIFSVSSFVELIDTIDYPELL